MVQPLNVNHVKKTKSDSLVSEAFTIHRMQKENI